MRIINTTYWKNIAIYPSYPSEKTSKRLFKQNFWGYKLINYNYEFAAKFSFSEKIGSYIKSKK